MNPEINYVIPPEETETVITRRFPVGAQLGLLAVFLLVIFGTTFIPQLFGTNQLTKAPMPAAPLVIAKDSMATIATLENIKITGTAAYVYDVRAKRALYNVNADTVLPLASITKLMTALLAHELVDTKQTIRIPRSAILQSGASGLAEGEQLTSQSLSDYAVLASSNDAAFALANAVGTVLDETNPDATFVAAMNIRAEELGLPNLLFKNSTGLDISLTEAGAAGTAREVSFLLEYILENYPSILEPTTLNSSRVYNEGGAYHEAENTNPIITKIPNLLGSKTGYTDLAGGNLTIAFDAGYNRPIIVTVLGSSYDGRFSDVQTLVKAVTASLITE